MRIRVIRMWEPCTGVAHIVEIFRFNGGYALLVDGAFYSDHESYASAEEEMIDVINWFGWTGIRPITAA